MQFNENFKSSKHVLQIEDKETGELAGKGTMEVQFIIKYLGERSYPSDVDFKMNVWVKDGRYKYQITDFIAKSNDKQSLNFGLITTSDETDYRSVLIDVCGVYTIEAVAGRKSDFSWYVTKNNETKLFLDSVFVERGVVNNFLINY